MKEPASSAFRKRLLKLREAFRWTQKRAAQACGIGQKAYQFYESGIRKNPELFTIEKIAKGFGVEIHELLCHSSPRIRKGRSISRKKRRQKGKPARGKQRN